MNILIIGFGTAGKFYFENLKKIKKVKKIYVHDTRIKINNSQIIKMNFNQRELKRNQISQAIIATPSNLHYKYAKILVKHSINILIEKPFVLKISDAKNLIKLSKNKKLKCWVVFQNRYNLAIQKLKKCLKKNLLGKVFFIDCSLIWSRDKFYYSSSWKGKYKSDGGVLANQAIHLLDALVYIFGEVKKFNSILFYNKKKLQAEDLAVMNFIHKNKLVSSFKATTRADSNYSSSIDVFGDKAKASINGVSLNNFEIYKKNKPVKDLDNSEDFSNKPGALGAMGNGHYKILLEFLDKTKKNSSKDLEIDKNLHVLKIIHSVYNNSNIKSMKNIKAKQSKLGK